MRQILIILSIIFSFTVSSCSGEKEESTTDTTIPTPIESSPYEDTSTDGDTTIIIPTPDTNTPTVTSVSTILDNKSRVSITDNITLTFSEVMNTDYVRTNTSDTNCSGTLKVSLDNFSTCIKMSSYPLSSNSNKTFTLDPYDNLTRLTTYLTRVTTGVKDTAGNAMGSQYEETSSGFTTDNSSVTVSSSGPTSGGTYSNGTTYYWKVVASDPKGGSADSETRSFTVQ